LPGSGEICQKWWNGWQEHKIVRATAIYVAGRMAYARRTRISRWEIPFLHAKCQLKTTFGRARKCSIYIRQSCVYCCDTELETPEDSSVKRPSYDLDLGAPDTIVVFFGAVVNTRTLLGCHVTIGKAIEIGANKVCRCNFCGEKQLFNVSYLSASVDN
jgi:hypothetical protein